MKQAFVFVGGSVDPERITERPEEGAITIAADVGWRNAERLGITPKILVGDFDSLGEPNVPEGTEVLQVPAEKNETDTQLAVGLAISRGAEQITVIGGLDGRLDHTLSNLAILEDLERRSFHGVITDGKNRVRFLRNNSTLIPRSGFRYLAILAADPVIKGVSIEGVKYPLKKAMLRRDHQYAVSNEIEKNCALIEVRKGGAWIVESADTPVSVPAKQNRKG